MGSAWDELMTSKRRVTQKLVRQEKSAKLAARKSRQAAREKRLRERIRRENKPKLSPEEKAERRKQWAKAYYSNPENCQRRTERTAARIKKNKEIAAEFRSAGCSECGESRIACLDAHHVDPSTKDTTIARAIRAFSTKRLRDELKKCICLCANCHRCVHAS